jgi:hypothetical protein
LGPVGRHSQISVDHPTCENELSPPRARTGGEGGAAAVEMALVMPLLLLLVFGIIEFGFIFNRYITLTHAAREGVRQLALGTDSGAAVAGAEGAAGPNADGRFGSDAIRCTASSSGRLGDETVAMRCNSTYRLRLLSLLPLPSSVPLSSEARMRKE